MTRKRTHHEPGQRQLRVGERIRHLLAEMVMRGDLHDPRLAELSLTVSEVRMSRDLRNARVFISELGAELRPQTRAALDRAAPWLAGRLAREANLKYAPQLHFEADERFERAARIDRLIDEGLAAHDGHELVNDGVSRSGAGRADD